MRRQKPRGVFGIWCLKTWYDVQNNSKGCVLTCLRPYYHILKIEKNWILRNFDKTRFWPFLLCKFRLWKGKSLFPEFCTRALTFDLNVPWYVRHGIRKLRCWNFQNLSVLSDSLKQLSTIRCWKRSILIFWKGNLLQLCDLKSLK